MSDGCPSGDCFCNYLRPELTALLAAQIIRAETLQHRLGRIVPCLFPPAQGKRIGRRAGLRRDDFRRAWKTACAKAGVAGRLRHDFRRTAAHNMVNAGVVERVAMPSPATKRAPSSIATTSSALRISGMSRTTKRAGINERGGQEIQPRKSPK